LMKSRRLAASGAAEAPPSSVMKSRRFMTCSPSRGRPC
jgi:hypothetical protein